MLDADTKRKIDSARDVLVGKVPDPKSQVEQITIALIYKFMDDMDQESIGMGGKASFFTGEYERFSWGNIFNPQLGGYEMLTLYSEALTRMNLNPGLPQLFRDIFKNAYLPYRDPETLKLFLKTISEFSYSQSESLGDAFEYLLQVMGSQGSAGQFLTPRHIINFMVQVVDPKKGETILDPACGTAGFLISAYRYILNQNSSNGTQGYANGWSGQGNLLTSGERAKMMDNFHGYDISPDMVRLSRANLYLHGFQQPKIEEYDTLTSEEKWGEMADVILANPPFMSPKGGIRPHKKFMVESSRSEVLFVDYIAEHLTANGRAAVIVPEGIIFQSGNAYKQLRKNLVEQNILWAVVSLPAGVFNPYSGVKTSILFMDKIMAKKTDQILFAKVEADGFDLGAQRKPIENNDLPKIIECLLEYKGAISINRKPQIEIKYKSIITSIIEKEVISGQNEFNLSLDRYHHETYSPKLSYARIKVAELIDTITPPKKIQKSEYLNVGSFPIIDQSQEFISGWTNDESAIVKCEKPLIIFGDHTCSIKYADFDFAQGADGIKILKTNESVETKYLYYFLKYRPIQNEGYKRHFYKLNETVIPIPPLGVQCDIVAELEGYQRIIDGARQVVENWKPNIEMELEEARKEAGVEEWEMVRLGEYIDFIRGVTYTKEDEVNENGVGILRANNIDLNSSEINLGDLKFVMKLPSFKDSQILIENDILICTASGSADHIGKIALSEKNTEFFVGGFMAIIRSHEKLEPRFLYYQLLNKKFREYIEKATIGVNIRNLKYSDIADFQISLPALEFQKQIVKRIEEERIAIKLNRQIIAIFEERIKKCIELVWEG